MGRTRILWVWFPLVAGSCALGALFAANRGAQGPLRWLGLALGVIGLAGVCIARYTLGRSFSIRAKATALVTRGIYSRIRNPVYIFGEIFVLGIAIMLLRIDLAVLALLIVPIQVVRARREARVLEEKFGDEYREYRKRTWF